MDSALKEFFSFFFCKMARGEVKVPFGQKHIMTVCQVYTSPGSRQYVRNIVIHYTSLYMR